MIPVDQTQLFPEVGNCLEACIASLCECSIKEIVPMPYRGWFRTMVYELEWRGLYIVDVGDLGNGYTEEALAAHVDRRLHLPDTDEFVIVAGISPRNPDMRHGVIYQRGKMVHDPHPTRTGLINIQDFFVIDDKTLRRRKTA